MVWHSDNKSFRRLSMAGVGLKMFEKIYDRKEDRIGYCALDVNQFLNEIISDLTEVNNDLYLQSISLIIERLENNTEII